MRIFCAGPGSADCSLSAILSCYIELVNGAFLEAGGTPDQFRAALARTISLGWLWRHESGTYVKFTLAGAEMFA
jgi:hypothetical protein